MLTHAPVPQEGHRGTRPCEPRTAGRRYRGTAARRAGPRHHRCAATAAPAARTRPRSPAASNAPSPSTPRFLCGPGAGRGRGTARRDREVPPLRPAFPMAGAGATAAAPWRGPPASLLLLGSLLLPASPRPPSVGLHRVPARGGEGKSARRFRGRGGGEEGGYWGWQPRAGRRQNRRSVLGPVLVRAQPSHTVLHPDQASAKVLCEGGLAQGSGEVQICNGRRSTRPAVLIYPS